MSLALGVHHLALDPIGDPHWDLLSVKCRIAIGAGALSHGRKGNGRARGAAPLLRLRVRLALPRTRNRWMFESSLAVLGFAIHRVPRHIHYETWRAEELMRRGIRMILARILPHEPSRLLSPTPPPGPMSTPIFPRLILSNVNMDAVQGHLDCLRPPTWPWLGYAQTN
jgi:hypothetical protein